MAEWLAFPTLDRGAAGLSLAGGEVLSQPLRRVLAQRLPYRPDIREFCHVEKDVKSSSQPFINNILSDS